MQTNHTLLTNKSAQKAKTIFIIGLTLLAQTMFCTETRVLETVAVSWTKVEDKMSKAEAEYTWTSSDNCIYVELPDTAIHTFLRPEIKITADIFPMYAYINDKTSASALKMKTVVSTDSYFYLDLAKATIE